MAPPVPRLSEHFALEGEAGRGGFGVVYRARHRATGELAAAKVSHTVTAQEDLRRVAREVELASRLQHPHLARLYGLFLSDDGQPALVYEWVAGGALDSRRRAPVPEVLRWVEEAGAALDTLHRQRLVHRDVKPENLMLDEDGRVRLVDYGLMRPEADGRTVTATGIILGTPAFMPPEAFRGDRVGPAADRFALAATAYWLLTGRPPFGHENPADIMRAQGSPPPPPRELGPEASPAFARAFSAGLASDHAARPVTCGAFAQSLREAWRSPSVAPETSPSNAPTLQVERRPLRAPSTPRRMGTSRRVARRRLAPPLAVLALGLGVGAVLLRPRAELPASPSPLPTAPAAAPALFDPARLVAIRDDLNDLQAVYTDVRSRILTDAQRRNAPSTQGVRRILDGDPLHWPSVLNQLPDLQELLAELAAGVSLEELPEAFRDEARRTDTAFQAQGLPRPFGPHWGLLPEDDSVGGSGLSGWAGAAKRELLRATASLESRGRVLIDSSKDVPGLEFTQRGLALQSPGTVVIALLKSYSSPQMRKELGEYLRDEVEALHRALLAAGRSLRDEPETRAEVVTLFGISHRRILDGLYRSYLAQLPARYVLGPLDESDPDTAYLLLRLPVTRWSGINPMESATIDLSEIPPRLEALARTATSSGDGTAARLRQIDAWTELTMGLNSQGRSREALELYATARRDLAAAGQPIPKGLVHMAGLAFEEAGAGLPPNLARELRAEVLTLPSLDRLLGGHRVPHLNTVRWMRGDFHAATRDELVTTLDAAVAACEAEDATKAAARAP